tara:strand:+ start:3212 stop:3421 length:210 start_codon:yes stop_codon:yes gene_type:complete
LHKPLNSGKQTCFKPFLGLFVFSPMFAYGILVGPEGRRTVCPGLFRLFSKDKGTLPRSWSVKNWLQHGV